MKTILVVEDDVNVRETFADFLMLEGFQVVTANHGREGLIKLAAQPKPDLVLLDMLMPVMSGQEMLNVMIGDAELIKTPVILVSATSDKFDTVGAAAFLKKPVDLDELLILISKFTN